jgi:hypothetical protein
MFSKRKYLIAMQCISDDKNTNALHWFFQGLPLGFPFLFVVDHCILAGVKMQLCTWVNKHGLLVVSDGVGPLALRLG